MATIKTKSEAVALARKLVPERSDSDGSVIDLLIALGVWTPESEPVVEKTPWELFKSKFCRLMNAAFVRYSDEDERSGTVVYDVKQAIGAAGLKLIKASDELVAVDPATARNAIYNSSELLIGQSEGVVTELSGLGIVLAKRAGA